MSYIDYKATVWFRIPVENEKLLPEIITKLEQGMLPAELYNDGDEKILPCEILYDTEEFINPNENDGQSTIEVYEFQKINNCTQPVNIWNNSYESEIKRKKQ